VDAQFGRHSGSGLTTAQPVIYRFAFKGLIERTTLSDRSLAHDVGTSLFALFISVNSKQPQLNLAEDSSRRSTPIYTYLHLSTAKYTKT
jgi:hypothetical protein